MRTKITRPQVSTTIDPYLKAAFEATREIHKLDYNEVLEKGIREVLMRVDPVSYLEHEVRRMDLEKNEKLQEISRLKFLKELQPPQDEDLKKEAELEEYRKERFLKEIDLLKKQMERGDLNYTRLIDIGEFKNNQEVRDWIKKHSTHP